MSAVETRNLKLETRRIRTCSHIKVNGLKCGSPALRHQTLCYFHFQWDRRERRRVRLGGPVGTNKNTGIEFPILEGPESIMLAIMEVQHALLDARIDRLTAHTLLYSLQLAMQLKIGSRTGLAATPDPVLACPELESELDLDRARGLRPSHQVCSTCEDLDICISPEHCPQPTGAPFKPAVGLSGVVPDQSTTLSPTTTLHPCHPERRSPVGTGVEGPSVSSPEATTPDLSQPSETTTTPLRESSPAGECEEKIAKINASRACARRQISSIYRRVPRDSGNPSDAKTPDSRPGLLSRGIADDQSVAVETRNSKLSLYFDI